MREARPTPEQLAALAPLAGLTAERLKELAEVALVERAPRGSDPLRSRRQGRALFLVQGELLLAFEGGGTVVVVGGTGEGCQAKDTRLKRDVALKVLLVRGPGELKNRTVCAHSFLN